MFRSNFPYICVTSSDFKESTSRSAAVGGELCWSNLGEANVGSKQQTHEINE